MIQDTLGPNRYSRRPERLSLPARLALIVATAAAGLVVVGGVAYAGSPTTNTRIVVQPGQTLWGIAAAHYPGTSIEQAVSEIESANHLERRGYQAWRDPDPTGTLTGLGSTGSSVVRPSPTSSSQRGSPDGRGVGRRAVDSTRRHRPLHHRHRRRGHPCRC